MGDGNYIKINRKILDWEWYSDINTCRLFLHMLLKANWKDGRFQGKDIPRGSFVSSLQKLSDETELTIREIRTAISHLKTTGEVTSKGHSKYSVFTVVNYELYQSSDTQEDKQPTSKRHSNDILTTTIEEGKKEKREEGNINYSEITGLYNSICLSMPKVQKITDERKRAMKSILAKYSIDELKDGFRLAEESDFLSGRKGEWKAGFDWIINKKNLQKILEGNYTGTKDAGKKNKFNNFPERTYNYSELEKQLNNC